MADWTIIDTGIQGDISYELFRSGLTASCVDLTLTVFGERWSAFDIAFEYRRDERNPWETNAVISSTTAEYLRGNKLYGLSATKEGLDHTIRWEFAANGFSKGQEPAIRIRVLPRIKSFLSANDAYTTAELYGENLVAFEGVSDDKCIGTAQNGSQICVGTSAVYIVSSGSTVYSYSGVSSPKAAIQIFSDRYIVCDTGNNRVIELDNTMSSVLKTYAITSPVFADYDELNENLLVTSSSGIVREITWSDADNGTPIWQLPIATNSPQCATYKQDSVMQVLVMDTGNHQVVQYNRTSVSSTTFERYSYPEETVGAPEEVSRFVNPFRGFWYTNGNMCVVEKVGKLIDFDTVNSSSSSSTSSSSSSSTSSSSSSTSSSTSSSSSSSISSSSSSSISSSSSSSSSSLSSSSSSIDSSSSSSSSSPCGIGCAIVATNFIIG